MTTTRQQSLGGDGAITVHLRPEEVALISSALTWMKADIEVADKEVSGLNRQLRQPIPPETFSYWKPLIDHTQESLIVQSFSDCDERGDAEAKLRLSESIERMSEGILVTQQAKHMVLAAFYGPNAE